MQDHTTARQDVAAESAKTRKVKRLRRRSKASDNRGIYFGGGK